MYLKVCKFELLATCKIRSHRRPCAAGNVLLQGQIVTTLRFSFTVCYHNCTLDKFGVPSGKSSGDYFIVLDPPCSLMQFQTWIFRMLGFTDACLACLLFFLIARPDACFHYKKKLQWKITRGLFISCQGKCITNCLGHMNQF